MTNNELTQQLNEGELTDTVVVVSDENLYNIQSVINVDGSTIITIKPLMEVDGSFNNTNITGFPDSSGGTAGALDVFGNLSNVSIGGA